MEGADKVKILYSRYADAESQVKLSDARRQRVYPKMEKVNFDVFLKV